VEQVSKQHFVVEWKCVTSACHNECEQWVNIRVFCRLGKLAAERLVIHNAVFVWSS